MKTYNQFINESIRDLMTPKSKEDVKKSLDKLRFSERLDKIEDYDMGEFYTEEEKDEIYKGDKNEKMLNGAIQNNNLELVKSLSEYFVFDDFMVNGLIRTGNYEMVKLFINKDNVELLRSDILSSAVRTGSYEVVEYLISLGLEPEDDELRYAISIGSNPIVHLILDNDVHPSTNMLLYAIGLGRPNIVDTLLRKGAYNEEALDYAIKLKNKKIIKLLKDYEKF